VFSAIYSTASGGFALQMRARDAGLSSFTSAFRLERGVIVAWSKTMTTKLAKVTGLALLAASFAFSGSLAYADTEDAPSIQVLTFDAVGDPGEIIAVLDCDTGDGMGNCPVDITVATETPATTVADAFDPAVLEATPDTADPAIHPVDTIIVTGDAAIEGPATAAIPAPAAETAAEDETTGAAAAPRPNEEKAGEASAAIVVEVTQSETWRCPVSLSTKNRW
jgi:hypothetical protein